MATLYTYRSRNILKSWILIIFVFLILILIGWWASYYFQNQYILYFFIIFSILMNFISYWYSDKIVLKVTKAYPAKKDDFFDLYTLTENLAITSGIPMPKLYVIDDPAPNAFATGRNKNNAAIAVTIGLLNLLSKSELEGVIAHEISHIKNKDILLSTMVVVLVGIIVLISDFFMRTQIYSSLSDSRKREGGFLVLVSLFIALFAPLIATLFKFAISRKREFLADSDGALLTRYPEGLASALEKIGNFSQPMKNANNATAHLFISNPFGRNALKGLNKLFMTHPPIEERIAILRGLK